MRFGLVLGALLLPFSALAGDTSYFGPIVPACTEYAGNIAMCQACNLVQLADNLLKFFVSLAVMASALMFAYAGFLYVTAAANQHNLESAKKIFSNVLIGLIFVLVAFLIIDLILRVFTQSSFNVLTRIQCVRVETNNIQVSFPNTPPNNPVGGTQGGGQPTTGGTFNAPPGSCVAISQQNAERLRASGVQPTANCNPGQRVENYGSGASGIATLRRNHGQQITQCANRVGINENIIISIAVLECGGASTCQDRANVPQCQKGNGATGISCAGVDSYCRAYPSDPNCAGFLSMNEQQKAQRIASTPALAFCATGNAMKNSHRQGEDWADTAGRYNGPGGYEPSVNCPGYSRMQCPIAGADIQDPWCHTTCSYRDSFTNIVTTAGGI